MELRMPLTIKLFGMTKALANNQPELTLSLEGRRLVKDLVAQLDTIHPHIGELIRTRKVVVSVNHDIATEDTEIHDQDEVALLPPFAGGAGPTDTHDRDDTLMARVQRENFSIDAELDRLRSRSKRIGGISVFLGTARDRSKGRDVSGITFDYYDGMAQKTLREIRERALKDFDIIDVLILHRYGRIDIGDNIVLIIVGAEHRAEAFRACTWAIDELKHITPIWKLEHTSEGDVWVEEHP